MQKFEDLSAFIDRAVKSRKYSAATGHNFRVALKTYEAELHEEEKESVAKFKENLNQITNSVGSKNNHFSASTIATYKSRINKLLSDFEKYADPLKMNSWSPKVAVRSNRVPQKKANKSVNNDPGIGDEGDVGASSAHRIELVLRPGAKFMLIMPRDITSGEFDLVSKVFESLRPKNEK